MVLYRKNNEVTMNYRKDFSIHILLCLLCSACSTADFLNRTGQSSFETSISPPSDSLKFNGSASVNPPSNTSIIKYLNRATCLVDGSACDEERKAELWRICIDKGFQVTQPVEKIKFSRELSEMVSEIRSETHYRPIFSDIADENGIVQTLQTDNEAYQINYTIEGYCIGSEYILE